MPTYDYRCTKCDHLFELFHSMSDESVKKCPKCKGKSLRVPSEGAGLLFKGSGFYITDYRSKSYQDKAKQDSTSSTPPPSSASDAKPAAASASAESKPAASRGAGESKPSSSRPSSASRKKKGKSGQ